MNLSSPEFVFFGIFMLGFGGPILAIGMWTQYRLRKGRLALKNSQRTDAPVPPFDPKPEPAPGMFLIRYNLPQQSYLRQRGRLWRLEYILCSWVLFVLFCENLPPQMADSYGMALSLPESVWYSYLRTGFGFDLVICGIAAALLAAFVIRTKPIALRFERTRPLTLRFLFWGRTAPALTSLLAAIATAALGFLLLLLIFYGPVWNHVPSAIIQGITTQQADLVISTLQTSPLRPVLSLLTTSMLIFSFVLAIRSLPWSFIPRAYSKLAKALEVLYWMAGTILLGLFLLQGTESLQVGRVLFLYNAKNIGPAPSYAYALIPVLITAALLELAQFFNARNEIP